MLKGIHNTVYELYLNKVVEKVDVLVLRQYTFTKFKVISREPQLLLFYK